jgi:Zn-dependent protease with chaperone function
MEAQPQVPRGPSLAGRYAAAIALTVGFYVLALAIAGGLLAAAILPWALSGDGNLWVTLTGGFLAITILVAIFPRRSRFEPPGLELAPTAQPRLHDLIADEARACGERPPEDVYVTLEVNAAVTEVGRHRRVMIVGLPLLHVLSARGLRSVVAHEFGHYAGGDTRLGPWIYRTRETIGRTIGHLSDDEGDETWSQRAVRAPFLWYGKAFLRITSTISRRQEFAADALAARHAGRDVQIATLRRIHAYGPAFDAYWAHEVTPVLEAGRRPPVVAGFARFIGSSSVEEAAAKQLEQDLAERSSDPYDSHPTLPERIAAAEGFPPGEPDDSPPAISLLRDPEAVEDALLAFLFGPEALAQLEPIAWDDVGGEVYAAHAAELLGRYGWVLEDRPVGELAAAVERLDDMAAELARREELTPEAAGELAAALLTCATGLALQRAGWAVDAAPGEPVRYHHGDDSLLTHAVVADLREGRASAEAWRTEAERLGIAALTLLPPDAPVAGSEAAASSEAASV